MDVYQSATEQQCCTQLPELRVQQATISSPRAPWVAVPTDPRGAGWLGVDLLQDPARRPGRIPATVKARFLL